MKYLESFTFPDAEQEFNFFLGQKRTCYDSFYPFQILSKHHFARIDFEPVTILYGGNGTGKSTALNVIAEKLALPRDSVFNSSNFLPDYLELCHVTFGTGSLKQAGRREKSCSVLPEGSCIITSDDVFDYMLNIRSINEGVDRRRDEMLNEYLEAKYSHFRMESIADYEKLRRVNAARSNTQSKFIRKEMMGNIREYSNGESAFQYFAEKIGENGLFLLDEPENSLSPSKQQELVRFIEDSVRFFGCQFVISTHSPFVLALKNAKIYDLDEDPVDVKRWTELANVRIYYDFFKQHEREFSGTTK